MAAGKPRTLVGDVKHTVCTLYGFHSELQQKPFLFIAAFSSLSN